MFRRYAIRSAIAVTVLALVFAGGPAIYYQVVYSNAAELAEWNRQIVNNDATPPELAGQAVTIMDSATLQAGHYRYMRNLFAQLALGIPLLAWVSLGTALWITKKDELHEPPRATKGS